jgi:peptide/nickel transport system ATP-binding protein
MNALNPTQKVIHFIEDVIQAHHPQTTKKEIYELARERFEMLGLPATVLQKYAVELSGDEATHRDCHLCDFVSESVDRR